MRSLRTTAAFFSVACLSLGCSGGVWGGKETSIYRARTDRELEALLGDYPSPGKNARSEILDAQGHVVELPRDRAHFATRVVAFEVGEPAPVPEGQNPRMALGPPDYVADKWKKPRAVSLGNGGRLTLAFDEGALIDGDGPDLFIWEIGPSLEAVEIELSTDGEKWIPAGTAPGGAAAVDIGPYVSRDDVFHFVRLRDVPHQGADSDVWPGADIDAVAILGSARHVAVQAEVLFAFDQDVLTDAATPEIARILRELEAAPKASVVIEGHTDDIGTDTYNQGLSERRARAVAARLVERGIAKERVSSRGFGKTRPLAPNDDDAHRRANRRVEIVIKER